jgi:L-amino acid N-acyltransferase YncA
MTELHVRTAIPEDAAALLALQADPTDVSQRELAELIRQTLKHYPFLVAEQAGRAVGYAYATAHRSLLALRWSVDVCVQVPGLVPEVRMALYRCLIRHLSEQGFMAIYVAVSVHDSDSADLHKRLGFAPIGVRQSIDLHCEADYWCMTLAARPECEEPVSFNVLQQRLDLCGR